MNTPASERMRPSWISERFAWYPVRVYRSVMEPGGYIYPRLEFVRWAWWERLQTCQNLNHGRLHFELGKRS